MGGAGYAEPGTKIKGGKWTVVKFFFVSVRLVHPLPHPHAAPSLDGLRMVQMPHLQVGYTCVWMAQCSELGFYRKLYGPSVLLKMNIVSM